MLIVVPLILQFSQVRSAWAGTGWDSPIGFGIVVEVNLLNFHVCTHVQVPLSVFSGGKVLIDMFNT